MYNNHNGKRRKFNKERKTWQSKNRCLLKPMSWKLKANEIVVNKLKILLSSKDGLFSGKGNKWRM